MLYLVSHSRCPLPNSGGFMDAHTTATSLTLSQKLQRFYEAQEQFTQVFYWFASAIAIYLVLFILPFGIGFINDDMLFPEDNAKLITFLHYLRFAFVLCCTCNFIIVFTRYRDILLLQYKDLTYSKCTCKDAGGRLLLFKNMSESQDSFHNVHITWHCSVCEKMLAHCNIEREGYMDNKI